MFFGYGPDLHLRKLITVYFLKVAENPKHTAILYYQRSQQLIP